MVFKLIKPIPFEVPSCMTPETIEVTINGTITIFNAFMKRSPKNWADCKTSLAKVGSASGKTTRAMMDASAREERICQCRLHCKGLIFICFTVA